METSQIIAAVSVPEPARLSMLVNGLRAVFSGKERAPFVFLRLPTAALPSSWGSITGKFGPQAGAKLIPADSDQSGGFAPQDWAELKAWVESGAVGLLPAGYAGALHAALNAEELKAELEWSAANPWRNGIKDHFEAMEALVAPFWPDPANPRALAEAASRFDAGALGVLPPRPEAAAQAADQPDATRHHVVFALRDHPGSYQALPWLALRDLESPRQAANLIQRQLPAKAPLFVNFEPKADCSDLAYFLQGLALCAEHGCAVARQVCPEYLENLDLIHRKGDIEAGQLSPLSAGDAPAKPDFRWRLSRLGEGRRARSATQERLRTQLLAAAPGAEGQRIAVQAEPAIKQRTLLAMMQGSATIMADDFQAQFHEGSFVGFFRHHPETGAVDSIDFVPNIGTALRSGGRSAAMETESAVSFETDFTRGLRETLVLRSDLARINGRMCADFLLADRTRHLLLDCQVRYPWYAKNLILDEVRPAAFCVALPDAARGRVELSWKRPDGATAVGRIGHPVEEKGPKPQAAILETPFFQTLRSLAGQVQRLAGHQSAPVHNNTWDDHPAAVLFGNEWTLTWQADGAVHGLRLCRLPDEDKQGVGLEVRLRPDVRTKGILLDVFPEGRYRRVPSDDLRSLNHHFTVALYPIFDIAAPVPALDELVNKEVPPFFMIRES